MDARGITLALLTNNVLTDGHEVTDEVVNLLAHFSTVVESSRIGVRKPEKAFYEQACRRAGVKPEQVVFVDDLGINLKPARAMGMTTIKALSPQQIR